MLFRPVVTVEDVIFFLVQMSTVRHRTGLNVKGRLLRTVYFSFIYVSAGSPARGEGKKALLSDLALRPTLAQLRSNKDQ